MNKYTLKTIIISDANIDGHIVEIFINDEEIAYLEQESPFSSTKTIFLENASHFPENIKGQALKEAKDHLLYQERHGMSEYKFNANTSPDEYNQAGQALIERILKDPTKKIFQKHYYKLGKNVLSFFEKNGDGCGAMFTEDAEFIGFLDKQEKVFECQNDKA